MKYQDIIPVPVPDKGGNCDIWSSGEMYMMVTMVFGKVNITTHCISTVILIK